jgi:hypothetical protein
MSLQQELGQAASIMAANIRLDGVKVKYTGSLMDIPGFSEIQSYTGIGNDVEFTDQLTIPAVSAPEIGAQERKIVLKPGQLPWNVAASALLVAGVTTPTNTQTWNEMESIFAATNKEEGSDLGVDSTFYAGTTTLEVPVPAGNPGPGEITYTASFGLFPDGTPDFGDVQYVSVDADSKDRIGADYSVAIGRMDQQDWYVDARYGQYDPVISGDFFADTEYPREVSEGVGDFLNETYASQRASSGDVATILSEAENASILQPGGMAPHLGYMPLPGAGDLERQLAAAEY